jgi:hypothetical protein
MDSFPWGRYQHGSFWKPGFARGNYCIRRPTSLTTAGSRPNQPSVSIQASRISGECRDLENHVVSSTPVTELRKHPRLPISFPLFACGVDANGKPFKALQTALNVSSSGNLVLTSAKLVPARHLQIELPVGIVAQEARQTRREVRAEVVRVEQRARSKLVGLRFGRRIA